MDYITGDGQASRRVLHVRPAAKGDDEAGLVLARGHHPS